MDNEEKLPVSPDDFEAYFEATGHTAVPLKLYDPDDQRLIQGLCAGGLLSEYKGYVTTPYVFSIENEIARKAIERVESPSLFPVVSEDRINRYIKEYEELEGKNLGVDFHLADYQAEAVRIAANSQLFVLTGGPGTGKTCVLKCLRYVMERTMPEADILFAAPTGKAARRITESTGEPAQTVHKLMRLQNETDEPRQIFCDCLIVDEISMLDDYVTDALFCALQYRARLILVGDVDQLPSVGFGSVLRDLLESFVIPCEKLAVPQRQKSGSNLFDNITCIKNGANVLFEGEDFHVVAADDRTGKQKLLEEYLKAVDKWGIDNVCCLTPYRRKGLSCANVMNDIIQDRINPSAKVPHITVFQTDSGEDVDKDVREVTFGLGDPVIQLVNRREIANGDVGKIIAIDEAEGRLTAKYDGGVEVEYCADELDQLNLAYAMSVHKSQGSEYKCVVTSALPEHKQLLSRNMLYTAVTRAKKECVVVCDQATVKVGLKREAGYERETLLSELIAKHYRMNEALEKMAS